MPFLVTTRRVGRLPGKGNDAAWSRQAVATLGDHTPHQGTAHGEAWRIAWNAYGGKLAEDSVERRRDLNAALALPAFGGTVGPLPDGTLVEVEPIGWPEIWLKVGDGLSDAQALDAFNARQATE